MWLNFVKYLLAVLLILPISGTDGTNEASQLQREQRSNRRIVKLYSGTRPKPIECIGEGFQADTADCTIFHRCIKNGNGRYFSFRFQCGPGTIYDPETESCNHPERTKRTNCGGNKPIYIPNIELPYDNDISKEIPSPISTKDPVSNHKTTLGFPNSQTTHRFDVSLAEKYPWILTTNQQYSPSSSIPWVSFKDTKTTKTPSTKRHVPESHSNLHESSWISPQNTHITTPRVNALTGDMCTSDGFMGDSENCRKFYRCINNQRGGFIRYEFLCSEPTIWDEDKQSCNHHWAVKRRRCGRGNSRDGNEITITNNKQEDSKRNNISPTTVPNTAQSQLQINYGSEVTQTQTQISNGSVVQNQTQINYGNSGNHTATKPNIIQNQTQISHGDAISQTQTQINYGDKAVQTQLQIDHSKNSSQAQSQISESTSTIKTTQYHEAQITSTNTNICTENGFVGDPEDCKKFYRCVDNGRGGFTRYEFSCSEGTVWDSKIEACNHAWAVKDCGGKSPSAPAQSTTKTTISPTKSTESSSISTQSTTTPNYSSTEEGTEEDNDIPYGNQPSSSATSKPTQKQTTTTTQISIDSKCRSSGFMGDNNDCKKFYRCVDNGNGGYTRYEFSCGEGTVWDQKIEACNHAWAVDHCGGSSATSSSTQTINTQQTVSTQITSQVPSENDDYDTGYGSQQDEPISSSTTMSPTTLKSTTSTTTQPPSSSNDCTTSGFMGDNNDCKKFYRCVDNGNGGYTRYEFTCGEGTVWDQKIQACNHAWAVDKCGGGSDDNNDGDATTLKDVTSSASTSTTQILYPDEDNDVGYGQQSSESPSITSTPSGPINQNNENNDCTSSGFKGDNIDCKKFYRCVNDGKGGFIKYEFSCGEGTVWDQSIDACNHPWAVKGQCSQPGNNIESNPPNVQSTTTISSVDHETKPTDEGYNQQSTQTTSKPLRPSGNKCTLDGFYGDENNCKNFYRCVDNGQGGFTKYEFTCGDGTVWNQEIQACDHEASDNNCKVSDAVSTSPSPPNENDEMLSESTTKEPVSSTTSSGTVSQKPQSSNDNCKNEGFYGDSSNCKKFYRCVDDGKGGFTKYDFTCGDGTIWDQEILACNHETSNKNCTAAAENASSVSGTPDSGVTDSSSSSQETTHQPDVTSSSSEDDSCNTEGFFANTNDCKKFYRCVGNGKGGYTKYDFSCGEGTVWVQEIQACDYDNDITSCSHQDNTSKPTTETQDVTTTASTNQYTTQSQEPDKSEDEYSNNSSSKPPPESEKCTAEGFYGNTNDCTRFYRCVDNGQGGYTRYDFTCGEGTAWDSNLQTCNHISEVESCQNQENDQKPSNDEETPQSSEDANTSKDPSISESSKPCGTDKCNQEGYFGNTADCTKFYRCVDNGKGSFTKYDFTCGEGTIWDQDITTCNHPENVVNPSCTNNANCPTSSSSSEESEDNTTSSTTESSQGTSENANQGSSNCSQDTTSEKPANQKYKCDKAGFYPDPDDCKKFYRCVDWDGDGTRFSIYHFDCGEGTIWDPQLETCNHEDSVYPPRNCSSAQSENVSQGTTTTEQSTTTQETTTESVTEGSTTTQQTSSSEQTTQLASTTEETTTTNQQNTTEQSTEQSTTESTSTQLTTSTSSTTTEKSTTEQTTTEQISTTQEQTTQESTTSSTTSGISTTEQTATEQTSTTQEQTTKESTSTSQEQTTQESTTTTQEQTTQESTTTTQEQTTKESTTTTQEQTTEESTTNQQTTTQQSSTSEQTTTQETTTNESSTTEQSTTSESTTQSTTSEQTTQQSTSSQQTTQESSSSEQSTTEQTTTETMTDKDNSTTETSTTTTTESTEGATESESATSQETSSSEKECPETDDDQSLYVCPTSFKRHPKYCNMFYQCTEDDNHEAKIATFKCPNNTIYDESKIKCVEEEKADKKCDGQIARKHRVKRRNADYKEPIEVNPETHICSTVGYYPFEKDIECSGAFLKCQKTKSGKLRGYVHRCPEGYTYWSISKRCEKERTMRFCKHSINIWRDRWEIPVERKNLAK